MLTAPPRAGVRAARPAICLASALLLAGCATAGAARYRGPPSDHFDGRRFHNPARLEDNQLADAARIGLHTIAGTRGAWPAWEETPTDTPPPRVGGGRLRVTFVNHATVLLQFDSLNVLTDPVWAERVSPVRWFGPKRHRPPGIRFDDLPPIDVVVISHNHYDHMDLDALRRLAARFHPRIVTGLGNAAYLAKHGVAGAVDIDWWQSVPLGPTVRLTGVPAQHWSARSLSDQWRTLWLGFVIEAPSGSVYYAGDTGFADVFTEIRERFGALRLAVLPIAPARPRRSMAARHTSAGDAVRADSVLGASTALAVHFGTFRQGDDGQREPVDSLEAALAARPCARRFWALRNGEARFVPPAVPDAGAAAPAAPSCGAAGVTR